MATTSHVGSTGPWDSAGRSAAGTPFGSNPGGCAQRGNQKKKQATQRLAILGSRRDCENIL